MSRPPRGTPRPNDLPLPERASHQPQLAEANRRLRERLKAQQTPAQQAKSQAAMRSRRERVRKLSQTWMGQQIALDTAMGRSAEMSGQILKVGAEIVRGMRNEPLVKQLIEDLRSYLRQASLLRLARVHGGLYDGLEMAIEDGDGKQVDQWSRAAANLERVRASASGEQIPASSAAVTVYNANVAQAGSTTGMTGEDVARWLEDLGIGRAEATTVTEPAP